MAVVDCLCHWGNRGTRDDTGSDVTVVDIGRDRATDVLLRAVAGNVTGFATSITGLASSVQRTAVRGGTVARNMTELATGVALHRLRLAVTSKVVRTTTLVAGGRTSTADESTSSAHTADEAATAHGSTTTHSTRAGRIWAGALERTVSLRAPKVMMSGEQENY